MRVQMQDGSSFQFRSIHGFDFVEPYEMRYVDISYAFAAVVSKFGTQFQWGPAGGPDLFNITIATYSPDGSQLLGAVSCSTTDSGYFMFDGSYFQSYPTWSLTAIHMTRFSQQRVPYEGFNGYVDVQLEWSVVGGLYRVTSVRMPLVTSGGYHVENIEVGSLVIFLEFYERNNTKHRYCFENISFDELVGEELGKGITWYSVMFGEVDIVVSSEMVILLDNLTSIL